MPIIRKRVIIISLILLVLISSGCISNGPSSSQKDTDSDGWTDTFEAQQGTDPANPDTDGDGIMDSKDPDPLAVEKDVPLTTSPASTTTILPTTTPKPTTTPPTSAPTTTAPLKTDVLSVEYPWKSLLVRKGSAPRGVKKDGYFLEVKADLGRKLSSDEFEDLKDDVTLIDENDKKYSPFIYTSSTGTSIKEYSEGQLTLSWHADFAYGFMFDVESKSTNYKLSWSNYPLFEIGNPFEDSKVFENKEKEA